MGNENKTIKHHYVYCQARATLQAYTTRRAAKVGALRKAKACNYQHIYYVVRETPEAWETLEGYHRDWQGLCALSARGLGHNIRNKFFRPWDAYAEEKP